MKIAIDINELTFTGTTGVKVYTQEIVNALSKIDVKNEYILYANCRDETLSRFCVFANKNFKLKAIKSRLPFWTYSKFPNQLKKDQPDILFMPIQSVPFFKKPRNIKIVVTVHDLAFLLFPEYFTVKDKFFLKLHTKRAIKMADEIIVPSKATKRDIIKFYKVDESKITVVYHGITLYDKNNLSSQTIAKINSPYILFVGVIQPRKNIIRLIEAFEMVKANNQELKLIIVGKKGWQSDAIYKRAEESRFAKDIIFLGGVSNDHLDDLYRNALAFILPSLYEGFGMPVLEAMNYGIPCIVSDNSSLSEVSGDSSLLIDAYNSSDIAEKIEILCRDENLRKEFARKGLERVKNFNWEKAAEQTLEVFEST